MAIFKNIIHIGRSVANNIPSLLSRNNQLNYQGCATISSRVVEKKLGLPPKPKRPMSAFIIFSQARRPLLVAEHPGKSMLDITKIISDQWRTLGQDEKNQLLDEGRKRMAEYTEEVIAYEESLTSEQREMIKAERARLHNVEKKNKMKSKLRELERPKKPPTPFVLFMISKLKSKKNDEPFQPWLSQIAEQWNDLEESQKLQVRIEAKKLMQQYKTDVLMWEAKMIKMGHIDVVRSRALLGLKGRQDKNAEKGEQESTSTVSPDASIEQKK